MKKKKILIVDDEPRLVHLLEKVLANEGCDTDAAYDGKQGLIMAEKENYDLVILDIMLPKLNGLEVCNTLRENKIKTPIIILTARDTIEDRMSAFDAGADDYLSKPFSVDTFLQRVAAIIDSGKELRASLTDSEKLQSAAVNKRIVDNVPVSIITIDKQGNFTSANKYFKSLSKHGEYHGKNVFKENFFKRENLIEDYRKLLNDGTIIKRDHCFERNVNGEDKYLKIIAVPLLDEEGNIEGALSMALDNTESVQLHKKLQIANDELEKKVAKRTAELDQVNKELAKAMELKAMFVADVSHEMRTSLAIVQGSLELLWRKLLNEKESKDAYKHIFSEISRMSKMLSDMTLLSESETSKMRLDLKKIDINKVLGSVIKSLLPVAKEKRIETIHLKSKQRITIIADEIQLEKMIMNLVANAIRYNKPQGKVEAWIEKTENGVEIKIKDTGIGIPKEYQQDIFERFYRVDKARSRNEGGSGLGLAICKWVAEMHNGSIFVESELGKGSLFTVNLPK